MRLSNRKFDINEIERKTRLDAIESSSYYSKKLGSWIPPERNDFSSKRNHICEVCNKPVSYSDSLDSKCTVCNVVIHISCLTQEQRNQNFRNGWVCSYCFDDIQDSKEHFVVLKTKHNYEEAAILAQITISKTWRKYRHVKFYKYTLLNILRLQELARKIKRKNLITEFRESMTRPGGLSVIRASDLSVSDSGTQSCDPYIFITVVDVGDPKTQYWSYQTQTQDQTLNPEFHEFFLIPGIHGKQAIVFTIIDKDEKKDQFLGQAVLPLHHKRVWSRGGTFFLPLNYYEYIVHSNGVPLNLDLSIPKPTGSIEVKYLPMTSIDQTCGFIYGPSIENISGTFRHLKNGFRESNVKFGEEDKIKEFQTKKIWVVVTNFKLYLFKRFGESCRIIIDLTKTDFQINEKYDNLIFDFFLNGLPPFSFTTSDPRETQRWKISFLSAWQKSKSNKFHLHNLVSELVKLSSTTSTTNNQNLETNENKLATKRKSVLKTKSQLPLLDGRHKVVTKKKEVKKLIGNQSLYPTYRKQMLPIINKNNNNNNNNNNHNSSEDNNNNEDNTTSKFIEPLDTEGQFTFRAKLPSPEKINVDNNGNDNNNKSNKNNNNFIKNSNSSSPKSITEQKKKKPNSILKKSHSSQSIQSTKSDASVLSTSSSEKIISKTIRFNDHNLENDDVQSEISNQDTVHDNNDNNNNHHIDNHHNNNDNHKNDNKQDKLSSSFDKGKHRMSVVDSRRRSSVTRLSQFQIQPPTTKIDQWTVITSDTNQGLHLVLDFNP